MVVCKKRPESMREGGGRSMSLPGTWGNLNSEIAVSCCRTRGCSLGYGNWDCGIHWQHISILLQVVRLWYMGFIPTFILFLLALCMNCHVRSGCHLVPGLLCSVCEGICLPLCKYPSFPQRNTFGIKAMASVEIQKVFPSTGKERQDVVDLFWLHIHIAEEHWSGTSRAAVAQWCWKYLEKVALSKHQERGEMKPWVHLLERQCD